LEAGSPWIKLRVDPSLPTLFTIAEHTVEAKDARQ
jgi:hypothetical protein